MIIQLKLACKMKKTFYFITLISLLFSVNVYAQKEDVPVDGEWGDERIRSFVPAHPVVYINDNVLSIYMEDALDNLTIVVTDANGNVVYQDCISSNGSNYTHTILLSEQPQTYTITITHFYGYLTGRFSVGL